MGDAKVTRFKYSNFFAAFALLLIAGCAALGLQQPKTFPERVLYVQNQVDGWALAATNALNAGAISSADAAVASDAAKKAQTAIDTARTAFGAGDLTTAEGKLQVASAALHELELYLIQKGVKK
jgi:hypothetical protein